MSFPQCDSVFESRTPNGEVLQRVCLNKTGTYYEKVVTPGMCRRCKPEENADALSPPTRRQSNRSRKAPGILRRAMTYTEAVIEWAAAGRPERSQDEITQIYEKNCSKCKRFDSDKRLCLDCGCRVSDKGAALFNKIRMATQHCPKGYW